ncbi:hypothetical protein HKD21_10585 [Gluconobacter cerevisiae]|uniref:Uncharacterized protein n=1 Tax=Gluconobacter cerevisiae TaxID=1379734 RepID=A0ABR9YG20_9PROT|nr:hypothetical protein [Gluconobacter cerevisiae]MBF0877292.1 hypothetical protein [Gluconobacter cerevisiae]
MNALATRQDARVTGAVMVEGEMLCFDATDYDLEPGTEAVVIGTKGEIYVAPIAKNHPEDRARLARIRCALIPYVSGFYSPRVPEFLQVKVLGRYVPIFSPASEKAGKSAVRALERA